MKKNLYPFIIAIILAGAFSVPFALSAAASTVDITDESTEAPLTTPLFVEAQATSTAATTTPAIPHGDIINPPAEDILNTVIPPKAVEPTVTRPSATTSATSTPVAGSTKPKTPKKPTAATSVTTAPVISDIIEAFERTTNGESNAIIPSNYYTPLDNLTPESTYALSFVAMILGIMGAVLILKEPSESPAWMPGLKTQESLLDS